MNWQVVIDAVARKQIKKFPKKDAKHLITGMVAMQGDPHEGDVIRLQGQENAWRRRVGAYRIFYEIYNQRHIIYVFNIERRTSKTY